MKSLSQIIVLLTVLQIFFVQRGHALKCYTCNDCDDDKYSESKDCGVSGDTCFKLEAGDNIIKSCIPRQLCTVSGVETTLKSFLASIFGEKNIKNEKSMINCCNTDYCNAGTSIALTVGLMISGVVAAFFM